jgi:hypothetical protein
MLQPDDLSSAGTMETFQELDGLFGHGVPDRAKVLSQAQGIPAADLTAWLRERVANPATERYLLDLFYGEGGVTSGSAEAARRFSRELNLRLRPRVRRAILGWGEISQVAEVSGSPVLAWRHPDSGAAMRVVYKKMPPFLSRADAEAFVQHYLAYNTVLRDEVGIPVPHFDARIVERGGQVLIFVIQERVEPTSVCHEILHDIGAQAAGQLYGLILREYQKLYRFNRDRAADGYELGLDGQIPNWSIAGYKGDPNAISGEERLVYLDTNVPMIRVDGQDVVSTDMYFQALPGAARWLIKRLNLDQEVMDRYYQIRVVMLDFLGNIIVRHREDLVPRLVEMSNEALAGPFAEGGFAPFTMEEVQKYYRSDVATWRLWRSLKLVGVLSDGVSSGDWRVLRRLGEFYRIWTEPIF